MIRRWAAASIRVRLTGWYAVVLAAMLVMYATATYLAVRHALLEQLDDQLHDDFETAETLLTRTADGRVVWAGNEHPDSHADIDHVYEVWSSLGEQIHRSGAPAALPPLAVATPTSSYRYETMAAGHQRWRALSAPVTVGGHAMVMRVSRSEEGVLGELREILFVLMLGLPLVVLMAGAGGYFLARRALIPIDHLASEAQRISAERLHQRLSVPNQRDEIGRLAAVINNMLGRLESSFDQLRRFTADASHELRTPLSVIRGLGEAIVAQRRSPPEYDEAIGSMLEEVDRMSSLVDTLLRLSHADAGTIRLSREPVDLGQLAHDVASSLGILAEERNQKVTVHADDAVVAPVDRLLLREALTNVLDNAIKYSPPGSAITISVEGAADHATLVVADQGSGIPAEHRDRIFDRFFRVDEARSRDEGGAGLGLAIAKWAVEIHGGRITVGDRTEGGSEFRMVLPLTIAEAASDHKARPGRPGGES